MVSVPLANQDPSEEAPASGRRGFGRGRERDGASFEVLPDSIPPQNLEAEEAVLGGILLDPDAIGRVADVLQPEALSHRPPGDLPHGGDAAQPGQAHRPHGHGRLAGGHGSARRWGAAAG